MRIIDYCVVHKGIKPINNNDYINLNRYFLTRIIEVLDKYKLKINKKTQASIYQM